MNRTYTEHLPSVIDEVEATTAFEYLQNAIQWEEGIKSKKGFTRLAKSMRITDDPIVEHIIMRTMTSLKEKSKNNFNGQLVLYGCYLNYYKDGTYWTPNHTHKGTMQIVISLGGTRTLTVGKKEYDMKNGDVAVFGGTVHGVPKQDDSEPRISIAIFCKKLL